jgi:hypothetical protein
VPQYRSHHQPRLWEVRTPLECFVEKIGVCSDHKGCWLKPGVGHKQIAAVRHATYEHGLWAHRPRTNGVTETAVTRLRLPRPTHRAVLPAS